jgi:S1-C subfamily serine protease
VGSGFLFRPDGHILTNFHVVAGAEKIAVSLKDGRKFDARIVGADELSDLAVLKIEGSQLPALELGDSDAVRVGEFAFAIGTPMDLPYTFTVGVVSAKGRSLQIGGGYEFLQTDTAINPGNSGGPLCDIDGRVIGINTLISGTNRGLGFSIPVNTARSAVRGSESSSLGSRRPPSTSTFFPGFPKALWYGVLSPGHLPSPAPSRRGMSFSAWTDGAWLSPATSSTKSSPKKSARVSSWMFGGPGGW